MAYRIPSSSLQNVPDDDASSSGAESDRLSDWASSLGEAMQTKSLFSDRLLPSPNEALAYDTKEHGFNVKEECQRKGLDLYGRMRLINWIRREVSGPVCSVANEHQLEGFKLMNDVECKCRTGPGFRSIRQAIHG